MEGLDTTEIMRKVPRKIRSEELASLREFLQSKGVQMVPICTDIAWMTRIAKDWGGDPDALIQEGRDRALVRLKKEMLKEGANEETSEDK